MSMMAPTDTWHEVASEDGARVLMLVHRPAEPRGWSIWAHGGSWQYGSAAQWAPVTQRLSALSGWTVVSVDYRLAPAHPFPASVLDVLAALGWAEDTAGALPVVVGGDSAGGTIASCTALTRRDRGGRVPSQVLAYPPMDPDCAGRSFHEAPEAFPGRDGLRRAWRLWLDGVTAAETAVAAPWETPDLAGLAPVFLVAGDRDPVRDDVTAHVERLLADGVPAAYRVLPGIGHGDLLTPDSHTRPAIAAALAELTGAPV